MYTNIHILQLLRRHNMWSMRNQTFQAVLDKHQRGWVCRNGLGLFREGFTMTVWDQNHQLDNRQGTWREGWREAGEGGGGAVIAHCWFYFFPFSHFNKGLPSFTRPLGFLPAVLPLLLLLLLPLAGRRAALCQILLKQRRYTRKAVTQCGHSLKVWLIGRAGAKSCRGRGGSTKKKRQKQRRVKRLTLLLPKPKLIPGGSAAVRRVAD